ncbi:MAG: MJ0042-type zinc finger domain-containing protein, partial [Rhodanobacteraceae bacterium]
MYTQCPECLTVYAIDAAAIAQGHGSVRCGHCTMVFDALPTLSETLPPEPFSGLPAQSPAKEPPQLVQSVFRPPAAVAEALPATPALIIAPP